MIESRKFIEKLFDDTSIIKWDKIFSIDNWEYLYRIWYDYYYKEARRLMRELLDVALFCSKWWEDFREYSISSWDYWDRFYFIFKWWVWCEGYYNMAVDCVFEKEVGYDEDRWLDNTEIFSWFYYLDTLSLVINILELLDRSYKAQKIMKDALLSKNRKEYVIKYWYDVKREVMNEIAEKNGKEWEEVKNVEMNNENLEIAKKIMMNCIEWEPDYNKFEKSKEEIAEKKCAIIKNLRFRYQNDEKFADIPKYINKLEPVVDLHANDEWKYPHIWINFALIWDWKGVDIEI